jgi:5-methylcytosine-specific restriction endonuclease McrA
MQRACRLCHTPYLPQSKAYCMSCATKLRKLRLDERAYKANLRLLKMPLDGAPNPFAQYHEEFIFLQHSLNSAKRQSRNRRAAGKHTAAQWRARVEMFCWQCAYCGTSLREQTLCKDHRIPLARGGTNWPSNLVPSCITCNSRKGAKLPFVETV